MNGLKNITSRFERIIPCILSVIFMLFFLVKLYDWGYEYVSRKYTISANQNE